MTIISAQAKKRRARRLRRNIDRLVSDLHKKWEPVAGKGVSPQIVGRAKNCAWEQQLHQLFMAECRASGCGQAAEWLIAVVRGAAVHDYHFYADMIASAASVGVLVPQTVSTVRTLGPDQRSPVISNRLRVAWSRAST